MLIRPLTHSEALVERLKQKMEQNPNDGVGWVLLARSYVGMGRHTEAVPIFRESRETDS